MSRVFCCGSTAARPSRTRNFPVGSTLITSDATLGLRGSPADHNIQEFPEWVRLSNTGLEDHVPYSNQEDGEDHRIAEEPALEQRRKIGLV